MTIEEYAVEAQKTASTRAPKDKLMNGVMGMIGEAGEIMDIMKKREFQGMDEELAREKIIDELGDVVWYVVEFCRGARIDFAATVIDASCNSEQGAGQPEPSIFRLCASVSKIPFLRGALEYKIQITEVMTIIIGICHRVDVELMTIMKRNIAKLRQRYGEKFDADKSNARYQ